MTWSRENWDVYLPIWQKEWPPLQTRLEKLLLLYAEVIPIRLKSEILSLSRNVRYQRDRYMDILKSPFDDHDRQLTFRLCFAALLGMIKHGIAQVNGAFEIVCEELEANSGENDFRK